MQQQTANPWYKEPWPWILISIIVIPMIVAVIRLNIYSDYKVEMVVDDYYKKGKSINQEFAREKLAKSYGISALVNFTDDHNLVIDINHNKKAPELANLVISLYHSTQAFKDLSLRATARADGKFSAPLPEQLIGKWQLTIEPYDKKWKIQKNISLPARKQIIITP